MCTVGLLLPPGVNPIAVKYIYHIIYGKLIVKSPYFDVTVEIWILRVLCNTVFVLLEVPVVTDDKQAS
jgi:hypothetical protein